MADNPDTDDDLDATGGDGSADGASAPIELDLTGQCLIAMPGMSDDRFARAVILITSHDDEGAMGIVVNRQVLKPTFGSVLDELDIPLGHASRELHDRVPIFEGGPVEQGRGFVVHSLDYRQPHTRAIGARYGLTTTLEILKNIAGGGPPGRFLLALGYAGWSSGQLEREIADNAWLTCGPTDDVLFDLPAEGRYDAALGTLGVDPSLLMGTAGHA